MTTEVIYLRTKEQIMSEGYECLRQKLDPVEFAVFISTIKSEKFDYTEWRRDKFDDMSLSELNRAAAEYSAKLHSTEII